MPLVVLPDRFSLPLVRDRFKIALSRGVQTAVEKGADAAVRFAMVNYRHTRRTGRATSRESIKWRPVKRSIKGLTVDFLNLAPYAKFIEEKTRAHKIRAKNAKFLRIPLPGGGVIYRREVNHPGSPAMPFMEPASWEAGRKIVQHVETKVIPQLAKMFG